MLCPLPVPADVPSLMKAAVKTRAKQGVTAALVRRAKAESVLRAPWGGKEGLGW